ncbi:MAG: hypothetical protein ACI4OJ_07470 [Lachnospiraceae bacterium]
MNKNSQNQNTEIASGKRVVRRVRVSEIMLCMSAVTFLYADALIFQVVLQELPAVKLLFEEAALLLLLNILPMAIANSAGRYLFAGRAKSGLILLGIDVLLSTEACAAYSRYVRHFLAGGQFAHGTAMGKAAADAVFRLSPIFFCGVLILLSVTSRIPEWRRNRNVAS